MKESTSAFKDNTHEGDWVFYHDALSLMCAQQFRDWMQERGYLKRWLLPSDDLFDGYPDLKKTLASTLVEITRNLIRGTFT